MARLGDKALDNRMARLAELEALKAGIEDEMNDIKAEVTGEMIARGAEVVATGKWVIRFQTVVSERFDTKAFKQVHADLYDLFTKATATMRFTKQAVKAD